MTIPNKDQALQLLDIVHEDEQVQPSSVAVFGDDEDDDQEEAKADDDDSSEYSSSLHDHSRFLAQKKPKRPRRLTCNKFPRICGAKGSPGPHCCKKRCVNVLIDRNNCGMCGKKCKYNQICCGGKCVNPSFNKKHCGGCNNRCESGGFCAFGLCNYA
ncbi:hypothetical protein Scep_028812 [Stephania cephalantha]|uniref:Stigma-specific STIG1-like protein 1 n=1 Tax=Stephania cephalantha TaxID=152367 RepID=A0AAP0HNS4_9MAGN